MMKKMPSVSLQDTASPVSFRKSSIFNNLKSNFNDTSV